ncbi:MAG TPA: hypothetical protein VMW48_05320 [Vicinamibacterales bacterium]|nr:hypothetical protein [Vicinamibacterales bacterium]
MRESGVLTDVPAVIAKISETTSAAATTLERPPSSRTGATLAVDLPGRTPVRSA